MSSPSLVRSSAWPTAAPHIRSERDVSIKTIAEAQPSNSVVTPHRNVRPLSRSDTEEIPAGSSLPVNHALNRGLTTTNSGRTIYTPTASQFVASCFSLEHRTISERMPPLFTHDPRHDRYGRVLPATEWDKIPEAQLIDDSENCEDALGSGYSTPSLSWSSSSSSSDGLATPTDNGSSAFGYFPKVDLEEVLRSVLIGVPSDATLGELFTEIVHVDLLSQ